jgi:hypothetical protein
VTRRIDWAERERRLRVITDTARAGGSMSDAAAELGTTRSTVAGFASSIGVTFRSRKTKKRKVKAAPEPRVKIPRSSMVVRAATVAAPLPEDTDMSLPFGPALTRRRAVARSGGARCCWAGCVREVKGGRPMCPEHARLPTLRG